MNPAAFTAPAMAGRAMARVPSSTRTSRLNICGVSLRIEPNDPSFRGRLSAAQRFDSIGYCQCPCSCHVAPSLMLGWETPALGDLTSRSTGRGVACNRRTTRLTPATSCGHLALFVERNQVALSNVLAQNRLCQRGCVSYRNRRAPRARHTDAAKPQSVFGVGSQALPLGAERRHFASLRREPVVRVNERNLAA